MRLAAIATLTLLTAAARADELADAKVDGTFVLYDVRKGEEIAALRPENADLPVLPASTFKVPNALIALETGVAKDEKLRFKWDGVKRWLPEWNRDHDLASAMKFTVVWYFQEIARRIGAERMTERLKAYDYGNADIGGGLDHFWIDGALRITARQQVTFFRRLRTHDLPATPEHQDLVARLIELKRTDKYVLRGKTGVIHDKGRSVGWIVGWVEKGEDTYVYALLVLAKDSDFDRVMSLRRPLAEKLLAKYGVL